MPPGGVPPDREGAFSGGSSNAGASEGRISENRNSEGHWREIAELEALGLASDEERAALRSAWETPAAAEARVHAAKITASIGLAAPGTSVPGGVRERVMAAVRAASTQVWKQWDPKVSVHAVAFDGNTIIPHRDDEFVPTSVPGVRVRKLFVDPRANVVTMLVRMDPGVAYPPHRHGGLEECFVLEGDLRVGEKQMKQGDFQFASHGSVHPVQSTDGGCLLYIRSSLTDELL